MDIPTDHDPVADTNDFDAVNTDDDDFGDAEFHPPPGWQMSRNEWESFLADLTSDPEVDKEPELVDAAICPSIGLPVPQVGYEALNTVNQSFDTESMMDFYALGSSSPMHPAIDPSNGRNTSPEDEDAATPQATRQPPAAKWKIVSHVRSSTKWMSNSDVTFIRRTIKEKAKVTPKPWQVSVMVNVIYNKKDVVVSAGTGSGKSLPYQLIPLIKIGAIVLVISPTIALMNDQVPSIGALCKGCKLMCTHYSVSRSYNRV